MIQTEKLTQVVEFIGRVGPENRNFGEMVSNLCGTELDGKAYRGLLPNQPLIYSSRGAGLSQNTKRRTLETGEQKSYKACDSLQSHLTKLYKQAGIKGGSSHSGRRTFANRVLEKTGDMDTVAQLLGHDSIDCTQRYLDVKADTLRDMFENAV